MRKGSIIVLALLSSLGASLGQEWLDELDDKLSLKTRDGFFRSDLSVLFDLEGYYVDQRPPGLLYEDESFANYRLSFFVDTQIGPHFYALLQARLDRGFDPGRRDFEARMDEYLLRWTPWNDSRLNLQFGKFATVVGNWVHRHYSWDNPLISAPLPYENMTIISDATVPASPAAFLARRNFPDVKDHWLPIIWGPAYTTGWEVFGTLDRFDYAFDLKNASISSQPDYWAINDTYWRYPTVSGRLGFRPGPAWNHGVSFSIGPYFSPDAGHYSQFGAAFPDGKGIGDYNQITLSYDVSYAWRHWQWWGEAFLTRFEVPNVGDADMLGYYLETKYKITSGLYAALRWNHEIFGNVSNGAGGHEDWGNDMIRVDFALGYRFTRHLQSKIQYSFGHREGSLQQGEQLVAAQVTLKF